ncbi:MAG: GIY-YIG nuclease family protein [Ignavibacteriales bacterium]|nr:GIY-YIG nuclease family protein [Ignavibacteriales bacterium]
MSFYLYIIISEKTGKYYIGQTKSLEERIKRHNSGRSKYTKHGIPWRLIHSEEYSSRQDAVKRERWLKSPDGWTELNVIKTRNVAQPG